MRKYLQCEFNHRHGEVEGMKFDSFYIPSVVPSVRGGVREYHSPIQFYNHVGFCESYVTQITINVTYLVSQE